MDTTQPTEYEQEALSYRVKPSVYEVGQKLHGGMVVKSVEDHLVEEVKSAIVAAENHKAGSGNWARKRGRLEGLLEALAAVQAGSSWFHGDVYRNLEMRYTIEVRREGLIQ